VITWILGELCHLAGDLDVPPPIQSRIYQEISNAMVGFQNCVKIADVPFPFPYAQLLSVLVFAFALITPVAVACFTRSFIAGPIFTMLVWSAIWCVNEVAKELENPFGMDVNDICLEDLHASFVSVLEETSEALDVQHHIREQDRRLAQEAGDKPSSHVVEVNASPTSAPYSLSVPTGSPFLAPKDFISDTAGVSKTKMPSPRVKAIEGSPTKETHPNLVNTGPGIPSSPPEPLMPAPPIVSTKVKQKLFGAQAQEWLGVAEDGRSSGGPLQAVHVIDSQLAQIGTRMEAQLAQIAKELEALSVLPAMARGRRGDPGNSQSSSADFLI
jgi:hypothetical protein